MCRSQLSSPESGSDSATSPTASAFPSIRDRFPFKRCNSVSTTTTPLPRFSTSSHSHSHKTFRSHNHHTRRLHLFTCRGKSWFYFCVLVVICTFALVSMIMQKSIMPVFLQGDRGENMRWRWSVKAGMKLGSALEFVPDGLVDKPADNRCSTTKDCSSEWLN